MCTNLSVEKSYGDKNHSVEDADADGMVEEDELCTWCLRACVPYQISIIVIITVVHLQIEKH